MIAEQVLAIWYEPPGYVGLPFAERTGDNTLRVYGHNPHEYVPPDGGRIVYRQSDEPSGYTKHVWSTVRG